MASDGRVESGVRRRVWAAYLSNSDTGRKIDHVLFEHQEDAMKWAAESANTLAYSGVKPSQFEKVADNVWKIDLNGPMNAIVCHSAVYEGVEHVAE